MKTKPSFPEAGSNYNQRVALDKVIHALGDLSEEGRRRVIYATAVFYGVLPIMVPDKTPKAKVANLTVLEPPKRKAATPRRP